MTDRLAQLLLTAVRSLPPAEQDEVLAALLRSALLRDPDPAPEGAFPGTAAPPAPGTPQRIPRLGDRPEWWSGPLVGVRTWTGGAATGDDAALKVLPVRLPAADYEQLRAFSREHGFSMAVVIRTLVERFLAAQARRRAWRDEDPDEPTTAGHA